MVVLLRDWLQQPHWSPLTNNIGATFVTILYYKFATELAGWLRCRHQHHGHRHPVQYYFQWWYDWIITSTTTTATTRRRRLQEQQQQQLLSPSASSNVLSSSLSTPNHHHHHLLRNSSSSSEAAVMINHHHHHHHGGGNGNTRHFLQMILSSLVMFWPLYDTTDQWSWKLNIIVPAVMFCRLLYKVRNFLVRQQE